MSLFLRALRGCLYLGLNFNISKLGATMIVTVIFIFIF